jgi:hypothetical protein
MRVRSARVEKMSTVADELRPSAGWLALAIVGSLLAVFAWLFTFVGAVFVCGQDTSECADDHTKRDYRGRLFDYEGRPASNTWVVYGSGLYGNHRERFRTDARGRFCVSAIPGPTSSFITVEGQEYAGQLVVKSSAPVDPRFADPAIRAGLRTSTRGHPLDRLPFMTVEPYPGAVVVAGTFWPIGAHEAVELWDPTTDAAATCQSVSATPAWYRFDDHRRSWQYVLLTLAPIAAIVLTLVGLGARRTARWKPSAAAKRKADRIMQGACLAALLTVALTVALWMFP